LPRSGRRRSGPASQCGAHCEQIITQMDHCCGGEATAAGPQIRHEWEVESVRGRGASPFAKDLRAPRFRPGRLFCAGAVSAALGPRLRRCGNRDRNRGSSTEIVQSQTKVAVDRPDPRISTVDTCRNVSHFFGTGSICPLLGPGLEAPPGGALFLCVKLSFEGRGGAPRPPRIPVCSPA
jgi:hypothetical protein